MAYTFLNGTTVSNQDWRTASDERKKQAQQTQRTQVQAKKKKQEEDDAKAKQNSLFNKVTSGVKSFGSAAVASERAVAKPVARLLPGGQNDLKAANAAIDSDTKNRKQINSMLDKKQITPEQHQRLLKMNANQTKDTSAQVKTTTDEIAKDTSRGRITAGVVGTAADILTAGSYSRVKGGSLLAKPALTASKELTPLIANKAARVATRVAGNATAGGANAASAGGSKKDIATNFVAGAVLPEGLSFGGKQTAKALSTIMEKVKPPTKLVQQAKQNALLAKAAADTAQKNTVAASKIDNKIELIEAKATKEKPLTQVDQVKIKQLKAEKEQLMPSNEAATADSASSTTQSPVSQDVAVPAKLETAPVAKSATESLPNNTATKAADKPYIIPKTNNTDVTKLSDKDLEHFAKQGYTSITDKHGNTRPITPIKASDTKKLDSLNPTGGLHVDYDPKSRATMPLADNMTTLDKTSGKAPDEMVTIYRGAPSHQTEISPGDFVTTNKELAKSYNGDGNVIERKVPASHILDDKREPLGEEYIYRPEKSVDTTPKKAQPVTTPTKTKTNETSQAQKPGTASATEPVGTRTLKPSETAHMPEIGGYTHSEHLAEDYAAMLRGQELQAKGGQMIKNADGSYRRTSEHSRFYRDFYKENKRAPAKADYLEQAKKELENGKDGIGAGDDYKKLLEREGKPVPRVQVDSTVKDVPQGTSRVGNTALENAVGKSLKKKYGEAAQYDKITIADQAKKAVALTEDRAHLERVISGEAPLPDGLRATALIDAIERHPVLGKDVDLLIKVSKSPLASESSYSAQELRLARERVDNSPVEAMESVRLARQKAAEKRLKKTAAQAVSAEVKQIRATKPKIEKETFASFVESLKC